MEINPQVGQDHIMPELRPLVDAVRKTPDGTYMLRPMSRAAAVALLGHVRKLEREASQTSTQTL